MQQKPLQLPYFNTVLNKLFTSALTHTLKICLEKKRKKERKTEGGEA